MQMSNRNRALHLDFESCSNLDLKKVGASKYAQDPSTTVLCVAYAYDDEPISSIILPTRGQIAALFKDNPVLHAWNQAFELALLHHKYGATFNNAASSCTMQRALHYGLPAKLEHAAPALGTSHHKDMAGHRLMLAMSRPRPKLGTFWHEDAIEGRTKLQALAAYCEKDVEAERAISKLIPDLPGPEKEVSSLDYNANDYGLKIDIPLVHRMIGVAQLETQALNAECAKITRGAVTSPGTQTDRLLRWLFAEGVMLKDVSKESISEALDVADIVGFSDDVIRVLSIRQRIAKSSVAKLQAMLNSVEADFRVRGTLQYYGAGRTGRFAGRLIQPQNFPRVPKGFDQKDAIRTLASGGSRDEIRAFHGEPLSVISSCLRGCIIPAPGRKFLRYDLSQIEARVLAWLAGQQDVLDLFESGVDVYTETAKKFGLVSREAGKVAVLGLGYGTGPNKLIEVAKGYGVEFTLEQSTNLVYAWRQANANIVTYWYDLDRTVKRLLQTPVTSKALQVGDCLLYIGHRLKGRHVLHIELPAGRTLHYHNIRIMPSINLATGQPSDSIVYDGVNMNKQWGPIRTWGAKLAENITQAVARDIIVQAALRVSRAAPNARLVLSVHDELVFEVPGGQADILYQLIYGLIVFRPPWAEHLPIAAEGKIMERYGK